MKRFWKAQDEARALAVRSGHPEPDSEHVDRLVRFIVKQEEQQKAPERERFWHRRQIGRRR